MDDEAPLDPLQYLEDEEGVASLSVCGGREHGRWGRGVHGGYRMKKGELIAGLCAN